MGFLILDLLLGLWVLLNARKRGANPYPWAIWTALLGPFILPFYLAKRPLRDGEVREGGAAWNITKSFALAWTLFMFVGTVIGLIASANLISSSSGGLETAGAVLGAGLGLGLIAFLWFVPFIMAILIGLLLRKSSIVERGPTLAVPVAAHLGASGIIGLALLVLGMIGVIAGSTNRTPRVEPEPLNTVPSASQVQTGPRSEPTPAPEPEPVEILSFRFSHLPADFDAMRISSEARLSLTVRNTTNSRIVAWRGVLVVTDPFGDEQFRVQITDGTANLSPGATGEVIFSWEDNEFIDDEPFDKLVAFKDNIRIRLIDVDLPQ